MDWSQRGMSSGGSVGRIPGEVQSNTTSFGDEGLWVLGTSAGASL